MRWLCNFTNLQLHHAMANCTTCARFIYCDRECGPDNYSVVVGGKIVGCVTRIQAAQEARPWAWSFSNGARQEIGRAGSREEAIRALRQAWGVAC
jgi:ribosomal protein L18E